jgi:hypothetical protein
MKTIFNKFIKALLILYVPFLNSIGYLKTLIGLKYYQTYRGRAKEFERLASKVTHLFRIVTDYNLEAGYAANCHFQIQAV